MKQIGRADIPVQRRHLQHHDTARGSFLGIVFTVVTDKNQLLCERKMGKTLAKGRRMVYTEPSVKGRLSDREKGYRTL
ncbi:MAG TPA: hypothetical protein DEV98_01710 [Clostridiales bacterium]|nr:hypothetical protein [Clostridiales bacterium]